MLGDPHVCNSCKAHQAESFCVCTDPSTLLCEHCFAAHHQKNKTWQHLTYPIAALKYAHEPEYLDKLLNRISFFTQIRKQTEQNLAKIEKCGQEYAEKAEELIHILVTQAKETASSLQQRSRDIEASLAEVEATLVNKDPELQTPYGSIMRDHLDCQSADFDLFHYDINVSLPQSLISLTLGNEVKCFCGLKTFPCISNQGFQLYDFEMNECMSLILPVNFTEGAVFCLLDSRTMLGVGGNPASTAVYSIDFVAFEMLNGPSLSSARAFPGIAKAENGIYVFGGYNPDLSTCEKLGREDHAWSACGNMSKSRSYFAPCVHQKTIYLADHRSIFSGLIEQFDIKSQTYSILRLGVPCEKLSHSGSFAPSYDKSKFAASFVIDEILWVLVNKQIGRWKISSADRFEIIAITGKMSMGNSSAFVRGSQAFIAGLDGTLYAFDSQTCIVKCSPRRLNIYMHRHSNK